MDQRSWEEVGALLKQRREDLHLTQQALADRAGLSMAIVQVLEGGRKDSYRRSTLVALAQALDWPKDAVDHLLHGEQPDNLTVLTRAQNEALGQQDYNSKIARLSPEAQAVIDTIIEAEERKQQS